MSPAQDRGLLPAPTSPIRAADDVSRTHCLCGAGHLRGYLEPACRRGLAALQGYAEALCQAYGEPVFAGSNRFRGEAYRLFCRADLSVMAEQPVTETSA